MALSKHNAHYGPQLGFPYYNPQREFSPYLPPGDRRIRKKTCLIGLILNLKYIWLGTVLQCDIKINDTTDTHTHTLKV